MVLFWTIDISFISSSIKWVSWTRSITHTHPHTPTVEVSSLYKILHINLIWKTNSSRASFLDWGTEVRGPIFQPLSFLTTPSLLSMNLCRQRTQVKKKTQNLTISWIPFSWKNSGSYLVSLRKDLPSSWNFTTGSLPFALSFPYFLLSKDNLERWF